MATTTSLTTTFAGKEAGAYIKSAFYANETLKYITVKENIDYKQVVRKLVDTITFADDTCDFTPTGTVTLTERILTLEKFQVHRQLCKNDFLADWNAIEEQNDNLHASLSEAMIANMLGGIAQRNETLIWQGVAANAGEYGGFVEILGADATVNVVSTPVAIDSTNVIAKIGLLVAATPIAVKGAAEKPVIYISQNIWEAFMIASAAAGNGWYTYGGPEMPKSYLGYQLAVCPGMPSNHMIMAQPSNLWFGTNVLSQWNEVKFLDMSDLDGSDNVRFKARFFAGVQYGFGNEIAAYGSGF